ncbi:MAG: TonB family protein [Elusimicrobiales bacterium]|nr:TonB family protein [Elusimicrobiales bacterium]MCK5358498.1 TonB family protein [Elusimicrobiales bacterium]
MKTMRQYLLYSSSAHFSFLLLLLLITNGHFASKKKAVYYIDFIGPAKIQTAAAVKSVRSIKKTSKPAIKKTEAKKAPQEPKVEKVKEEPALPLPKPSMLEKANTLFFNDKKEVQETMREPEALGSAEPSGIRTDFSDFPYPWYISLVRNSLSNKWMTKMPSSGDMRAVIFFSIKRDGTIKNLKVEKTSGNRLFDNAALSSVESAAPFDSLPDDFIEKKLSVHVEFKTME